MNKPCAREVKYMRLISWICHRGSEHSYIYICAFLNINAQDLVPWVELEQLNVVNNVPRPSFLLHIQDKLTQNSLLIRTQELKRDIIYHRINLHSSARQVKKLQWLQQLWLFKPCRKSIFLKGTMPLSVYSHFSHEPVTGNSHPLTTPDQTCLKV
jgi:hypothetical protein